MCSELHELLARMRGVITPLVIGEALDPDAWDELDLALRTLEVRVRRIQRGSEVGTSGHEIRMRGSQARRDSY